MLIFHRPLCLSNSFALICATGVLFYSVGAQNVKLACIQFRHSLEDNDREGYELILMIISWFCEQFFI